MSNKAIMLCVPVEVVEDWLMAIKSGKTEFVFDRKNFPNTDSRKVYLYCVKDGLVTTTDDQGNELWVRGNAVGKDKQFYNGKVFGECELYMKVWDGYGKFLWHTRNNVAYAKPKPIWAFKQYGKDKPMYRAISDWCYVEELEDDKIED